MNFVRTSIAEWQGNGNDGRGSLTSTSGVLQDTPYSFSTRFTSEDGKAGTNPEELLAAAHAACFTMALSFQLSGSGFIPTNLKTVAQLNMSKLSGGWEILSIHLILEGNVPGIDPDQFIILATNAKKNCPVSKALSAIEITLEAKLVS